MSNQLINRLKKIEQFQATNRLTVHFLDVITDEQIKDEMSALKKGNFITFFTKGKRRRIYDKDVVIIDDVTE